MKKILRGLLCLTLILTLTGCGEIPKLKNGEDAIITFKDSKKNISIEAFYEVLKDKYGIDQIIEMVDSAILNEKYKTNEAETKSIDSQIEQMREYYQNDESQFLEYIQGYGYQTVDELKVALSLNYKRELAAEDYVKSIITEKEIKDYYDNTIVGDITASHILIKPASGSSYTEEETAKAKEAALKEAKEVITKLNKGAKFADLAKEYSDDETTKSKGGNLGAFNRGTMETAFEDAVVKLAVGKYTTTPVETTYGYHIILKTAQKDKPTLAKAKDNIVDTLTEQKLSDTDNGSNLRYKALVELRKSYGFAITDDSLKGKYDEVVANIN